MSDLKQKVCTLLIAIYLFLPVNCVSAQTAVPFSLIEPQFDIEEQQFSSSGHLKLIWRTENELVDEVDFELEKSKTLEFTDSEVLYQGDDLGTFISGLENGNYYFRIRHINEQTQQPLSKWSRVLTLNVKHHSLKLALLLFGLGFFVFLATVGVLVKGLKDTKV